MPYELLIVIGAVVAAALGCVVGLVVWVERAWRRRRDQFERRGVTADAAVEGASLDEGMWAVTYRFRDRRGQEHAGVDFLDAQRHEQPAEGGKVRVVYLPDQPSVSGLAATWLRPRARV
jgi:hypothetical protein